jgi:hypothetical protein
VLLVKYVKLSVNCVSVASSCKDAASAQHRIPARARQPSHPRCRTALGNIPTMAHIDAWSVERALRIARAHMFYGVLCYSFAQPPATCWSPCCSCRPRLAPQHRHPARIRRVNANHALCAHANRHSSSRAKARDPYRDPQELSATDVFPRRLATAAGVVTQFRPSSSPAVCRCASRSDTPGCRACL